MTRLKVGDVVHFNEDFTPYQAQQPQAAIVTYVHSDHCVNLAVFGVNGGARGVSSVPVRHKGEPSTAEVFCELPPRYRNVDYFWAGKYVMHLLFKYELTHSQAWAHFEGGIGSHDYDSDPVAAADEEMSYATNDGKEK